MTLSLVKEIAQRLVDPLKVKEKLFFSNRSPDTISSNLLTLSDGYPCLVVLFSTLGQLFPEEDWEKAAHLYVIQIKEIIESSGISDLSLFGGLAGCCFAIQHASNGRTLYKKMLDSLNDYLFQKMDDTYFKRMREKIFLKLPTHPSYYDLISGICGIGVYALNNLDCPKAMSCLEEILNICIALSEDIARQVIYFRDGMFHVITNSQIKINCIIRKGISTLESRMVLLEFLLY